MTRLAHLQVEHHPKQVSLVVIGNAALGKAIVIVFFEPCVEAGFFRRLGKMSRPPLQFGNLARQRPEVMCFVQKAGAQLDDVPRGGGGAFAEPQRVGEIFFRVINGLERLWADALHIPQMKELVGGYIAQRIRIPSQPAGADFDGSRVSMLHAAASGAARKMIDKHIASERLVMHPVRGRRNQAPQHGHDLFHVVVGGIRVHDYSIVRGSLVEIGFLECADFYR